MVILRSTLFFVYFALLTIVTFIGCLPVLALPRRVTVHASRTWSRLSFWGLKHLARLDYEVRGEIPKSGVLVAAKHMNMWDTMALYLVLYDPAAVAKRELLNIPFYGWYLRKAGVIAIDRGGHASAL